MSELHSFLRSRRSIRRFKPKPIPAPTLDRILETALYAPSAHNLQPWQFIVVASSVARAQLADSIAQKYHLDMTTDGAPETEIRNRVVRTRNRIHEAPIVIVLCRDIAKVERQPDESRQEAEIKMAEQSVALAGLQLLLAAHAEGLAGTWVCWPLFTSNEIQRSLALPESWKPEAMFFLGYPAEEAAPRQLKTMDEVVKFI
jgi:coenzyme F420-0:L-glutamate ligase/coenzyme F420-1:gamma-L-glutamate ligase